MSIIVTSEPNPTGTALDVFADRKLMHESRGGRLLALTIVEHLDYGPASKLPDIVGLDVAIEGAVRNLAVSGGVVQQAVVIGRRPDLYFPPLNS